MKQIRALINKETLVYVCTQKKVSPQYLIRKGGFKEDRLNKWLNISETLLPTVKQAKTLAACLHLPFAALYMNSCDIDEYIRTGIIVTCSEVAEEIRDEKIRDWLHLQHCNILDIDDEIQRNVRKIVTEHPKMIEFTSKTGTSSGDAFLIATAMKYNLTIITEENPDKLTKIPQISKCYGLNSVNITELCDKENWTF